jgi:hypothetical protein
VCGVDVGRVTARDDSFTFDEIQLAKIITGLLREVDPNIDPSHVAHLPAETANETEENT